MKKQRQLPFNIKHYASISVDAHFDTPWEQIVTSVFMLIILAAFAYPFYLEGAGVIFYLFAGVICIVLLSLLFDFYFVIVKLIRKRIG